MTVELRPAAPDELEAVVRLFRATFGGAPNADDLERVTQRTELERTLVGVDSRGGVVATAGAYSFRMHLPGGAEVGCAGVCHVAVRADHRRRGLLTALMAEQLRAARERGEAIAALWASEAPIYGRFGFGPAAPTVEITLARTHAGLRIDGPVAEVELLDTAEAQRVLPELHTAVTRQRPGGIHRPAHFWPSTLAPLPGEGPPQQIAVLPGRGYVTYRLEPEWSAAGPAGTVRVHELMATGPAATAALWRFATDVDLAGRTVAGRRPVDDPLLAMLVDEGRAQATGDWPLQVRLVDLVDAFGSRVYAADDRLVLEVGDRQLPDQAGRWALHSSHGSGGVSRTDEAADLSLGADVLGTVFLGGVRTTQLLAAGRLRQHREGAAARLDRMLATEVAPWHGFMF